MVRRTLDSNGSGSGGVSDTWWAAFDRIHSTLEFDGNQVTDVTHRYLWGQFQDDLLADEIVTSTSSAGTIQWGLSDQVHTIRDIGRWDSGASDFEIANHRVFDTFGKLESETDGSIDLAFAFNGKWTESETGYTHHLNRWYDAVIGKWLSEDPIGFLAGDANLSRFVGNQALSHFDPDGLDEVMSLGTGSGKRDVDEFAVAVAKAAVGHKQEESDGFNVAILAFGNYHGIDNPSVPFMQELSKRLRAKLDESTDLVLTNEVMVNYDEIEAKIDETIKELEDLGKKFDVFLVIGLDPNSPTYEFEGRGTDRRDPGIPDERGKFPGDAGVNRKNPGIEKKRRVWGSDAFADGVNRRLNESKKSGNPKITPGTDAGVFICNSATYKLAGEKAKGKFGLGLFFHLAKTTNRADKDTDAVIDAIVSQLIRHKRDKKIFDSLSDILTK